MSSAGSILVSFSHRLRSLLPECTSLLSTECRLFIISTAWFCAGVQLEIICSIESILVHPCERRCKQVLYSAMITGVNSGLGLQALPSRAH